MVCYINDRTHDLMTDIGTFICTLFLRFSLGADGFNFLDNLVDMFPLGIYIILSTTSIIQVLYIMSFRTGNYYENVISRSTY